MNTAYISQNSRPDYFRHKQSNIARMMDRLPIGILFLDLQGKITYVNERAAKILRVPVDRITGKHIHQPGLKIMDEDGMPVAAAAGETYPSFMFPSTSANTFRYMVETPQNERVLLEISAVPFYSELGEIEGVITMIEEVTQREEMLRAMRKNEELLRFVVVNAPIVLWSIEMDGTFSFSEGKALQKLGLTSENVIGTSIYDLYKDHPEIIESTRRALSGEMVTAQSNINDMVFDIRYNPVKDDQGQMIGVIGVSLDITEQKQAEKQIEMQFNRISALHKIDLAIINSLNITDTYHIVLQEVIDQLSIDAADILLLDSQNQMLHMAASRGFHILHADGNGKTVSRQAYKVGEGYAGLSVLFRQKIYIPNLQEQASDWRSFTPSWELEKFVSYIGLPLSAKNQVKGVLELFSRTPIRPNADWLNFLNVLAGQVAIAIDNATMFKDLQQSNMDLSKAYDSTLEGWARALELRDKETEGHSQRVLHLTSQLAYRMGIKDDSMIHIRRGALLHDIGKMGIADNILQKPGPLNDEEWKIMRMHPVYAYNLLSPIPFLHPALDIPYCHHERWDGTGYPRGLYGDNIPLAARIFSIIDAWDALHHDRPYRKAWPEAQVVDYLREQSGKCFDPAVIKVFLKIPNKR